MFPCVDVAGEWAERIAQRCAPAPAPAPTDGGSGMDGLPAILRALAEASPVLKSYLGQAGGQAPAFDTLRGRLTAAGFDQARAGELAHGLLQELATDTASATQFLDALTTVPEDPAPAPAHGRRIFRRRRERSDR
jgi:hypothetical protein